MHVLITCKNEDDSIKNEWARVVTTFFLLYVYGIFPDAQGQLIPLSFCPIRPDFEFLLDEIDVPVTCTNEEDPIKNEGARVVTRKSEQTGPD